MVARAQLARPESKSGRDQGPPLKPTMNSFKESGQLEQDADAAFLVYPSNRYQNDSARLFCIAKNKEGRRPDPVTLAFYGDTQTMVELAPDGAGSTQFEEARGRDRDNPWR